MNKNKKKQKINLDLDSDDYNDAISQHYYFTCLILFSLSAYKWSHQIPSPHSPTHTRLAHTHIQKRLRAVYICVILCCVFCYCCSNPSSTQPFRIFRVLCHNLNFPNSYTIISNLIESIAATTLFDGRAFISFLFLI